MRDFARTFGKDKSPLCLGGMPRALQPGCIGVGSQPMTRWLNPTTASEWRQETSKTATVILLASMAAVQFYTLSLRKFLHMI